MRCCSKITKWFPALGLLFLFASCEDSDGDFSEPSGPEEGFGEDLAVGSVENAKEDGVWGEATNCKDLPDLEPLSDPVIVISLDGLTLHLFDRDGDYDKVFPVGVGAIEDGQSLTPASTQFAGGTYYTRTDEAPVTDGSTPEEARWGWNHQCRIWSAADGDEPRIPYFAGLPFIRFAGNPLGAAYGIHGPIDQYPNDEGGSLRRGYVSHGCIRMEAQGIKEVWARIQGVQAEVLVQQPVERRADGSSVDVDRWLLSECVTDDECGYDGGVCRMNVYTGRGFCSKACDRYCPDKAGHPVSYCAPDSEGEGFCTLKADTTLTDECNRYDGFVKATDVVRPNGTGRADVCVPGSGGWIGERCLEDAECDTGVCIPLDGGPEGFCSIACTRFCPDSDNPGDAGTLCVDSPDSLPSEGGICTSRCYNNDDCAVGTECTLTERINEPWVSRNVCLPL